MHCTIKNNKIVGGRGKGCKGKQLLEKGKNKGGSESIGKTEIHNS